MFGGLFGYLLILITTIVTLIIFLHQSKESAMIMIKYGGNIYETMHGCR